MDLEKGWRHVVTDESAVLLSRYGVCYTLIIVVGTSTGVAHFGRRAELRVRRTAVVLGYGWRRYGKYIQCILAADQPKRSLSVDELATRSRVCRGPGKISTCPQQTGSSRLNSVTRYY